MKKIMATGLLVVGVWPGVALSSDLDVQARQHIAAFANNLKAALQQGMKTGGVEGAIAACNEKAPGIAQSSSVDGWSVGRTSLKTRNTGNTPDAWEMSVLQSFEERLAAGDPVQALQASTMENGRYRYMKAIPTGKLCLSCHGEHISPALTQRLDELYPEDKARGYSEGDLRGAFTLSKEL